MKNYEHIFFDLDGTLTDSKNGITKSVSYALGTIGIIENDLDKLECFIGPPLYDAFMLYYQMNEEQAHQLVQAYRIYYKKYGIFDNIVYPGVREMLIKMKKAGKKIYLTTSKPLLFANMILEHFGLKEYFTGIYGATMDGKISDKEGVLRLALSNNMSIVLKDTVLIGDRMHDVEGARAVGIEIFIVDYGYGTEEEFVIYPPDQRFQSCASLTDFILLGGNYA
ncbi:MAG: HAD hydrolase-like protein [Clostridia bacterium]